MGIAEGMSQGYLAQVDYRVFVDNIDWTVVTKDGMPSVHVEHTLALTAESKVMVITAEDEADVFPPIKA